jgi:hypothetical protein
VCGNPPTFQKAGEAGIGAIAFNFEPIYNLKGRVEAYKEGIANCKEPIGQFMNDNLMMTNGVICLEDRDRARKLALDRVFGYQTTLVNLYHDTMPKREAVATWPQPAVPATLREIAGNDPDTVLDQMIAGGFLLVGNPEEVSETRAGRTPPSCQYLSVECTRSGSCSGMTRITPRRDRCRSTRVQWRRRVQAGPRR